LMEKSNTENDVKSETAKRLNLKIPLSRSFSLRKEVIKYALDP